MGEQREGSGILFREHDKRSDRHPDFIGEATYQGQRIRIRGWEKQGKRVPFLSLALEPYKEQRPRGDTERDADESSTPF